MMPSPPLPGTWLVICVPAVQTPEISSQTYKIYIFTL
jgi:hypothetical protein